MPLTSQSISESERNLLKKRGQLGWLQRLIQPQANADVFRDIAAGVIEQLDGEIDSAFKTSVFSETAPQYVIKIGENVLVLSGQWIYDSTLNQTEEVSFEKWDAVSQFPAVIIVRIARNSGMAVAFRATSDRMISLQQMPISVALRTTDEARVYPLHEGDILKTLRKYELIPQ